MELRLDVCECGKVVPDNSSASPRKLTCSCGLMKWNGSTSTWADQETFDLRKQAHAIFDRRWRGGEVTRKEAYEKLGFHFGQADKDTLKIWIKANVTGEPEKTRKLL